MSKTKCKIIYLIGVIKANKELFLDNIDDDIINTLEQLLEEVE